MLESVSNELGPMFVNFRTHERTLSFYGAMNPDEENLPKNLSWTDGEGVRRTGSIEDLGIVIRHRAVIHQLLEISALHCGEKFILPIGRKARKILHAPAAVSTLPADRIIRVNAKPWNVEAGGYEYHDFTNP